LVRDASQPRQAWDREAALHSVLAKIRDIHMPLISVNHIEADLKDGS